MRSTPLARLSRLLLLVASPFLLYPDLPGARAVAEDERPSSTSSAPLDFSDTALATLEPVQIESLWRHLRASAAWRVTREDGAWLATRRKVRLVLQGLNEIQKHGYLRELLPAESTAAIDGDGMLGLEEGYDAGPYEVVGHVASGEPGAV